MQTQPATKPELTKTIVINNKEALVLAQMPYLDKDKQGRIIAGEIVRFIPGVNVVDAATLKMLRENKNFDDLFKTRIARSPAPEQNPEKVGSVILVSVCDVPEKQQLKAVAENKAVELVAETFTVDLLDQWIKDEDRGSVRAAIENQKKILATGTVPSGA